MKNLMEVDGHKAVWSFDVEIGMFRGMFLGLSGGADFYAGDADALVSEARKSLVVYLNVCEENCLDPRR